MGFEKFVKSNLIMGHTDGGLGISLEVSVMSSGSDGGGTGDPDCRGLCRRHFGGSFFKSLFRFMH